MYLEKRILGKETEQENSTRMLGNSEKSVKYDPNAINTKEDEKGNTQWDWHGSTMNSLISKKDKFKTMQC